VPYLTVLNTEKRIEDKKRIEEKPYGQKSHITLMLNMKCLRYQENLVNVIG